MATPRIITARSMGMRFRSNRSAIGQEREVTGHYSGTPRAPDWRTGVQAAMSFHRSHLGRGWAGIGYHYVIPDDGAIICCRPVVWRGAHVLQQNDGRIGVNMPGTTGDRPTRRQARALNWLLHHAHTRALPRPHRTQTDLSRLPILGHREVPAQATACPGLFLGMYHRRGLPWEEVPEEAPGPDFLDPTDEDEDLSEPSPNADEAQTGPDEEEAAAEVDTEEEGELPEADEEFEDEDLSQVLAESRGS